MAQLPIVIYPDARLEQTSVPVTDFDASLSSLLENLTDTLYATPGIGLCAPQLGQLQQVVVMDLSEDRSALQTYINPRIIKRRGMAIATEACLSLPGLSAKVIRSAEILVEAQDAQGKPIEATLNNMHAICLQHEIDHLHGKLFFERISYLRRIPMRSTLAKLRRAQATDAHNTQGLRPGADRSAPGDTSTATHARRSASAIRSASQNQAESLAASHNSD